MILDSIAVHKSAGYIQCLAFDRVLAEEFNLSEV